MEGYEQSPADTCVMRRKVNGKVYLILNYIDDILVLADAEKIEWIKAIFVWEFTWITMDVTICIHIFVCKCTLKRVLLPLVCLISLITCGQHVVNIFVAFRK